ncbi:MAG: HDOD domain-containing protein [Bythopirellula sp.]
MTVETPTVASTELTAIDELVSRARTLYTLPAVAAEVLQLTSNPQVDNEALKDCIEADPALTAKILRVVNSSLFGLSREVCDLSQALALLGTKPLKLLVLGFSLPENLFAEVAREQLDWYWSTTLARAVAAREISEQLFDRPGDDAFLAGLLQDIGVLVLLGELKEPYVKVLSGVIEQKADLSRLETDSLGFDHLQLTAALLEHWNMPKPLIQSISTPRQTAHLAKSKEPHAELARVVHLAELVAELVGQNRLGVLPDLMEVGQAYCELDKEQLTELVGTLQPKVKQLAEVLSLNLDSDSEPPPDYVDIMTAAHRQMSEVAEEVVALLGHAPLEEEEAYSTLVADATQLRETVDEFLHHTSPSNSNAAVTATEVAPNPAPSAPAQAEAAAMPAQPGTDDEFLKRLTFTIGHCRSKRDPVSLLLVEIQVKQGGNAKVQQILDQVLDVGARTIQVADMLCDASTPCRRIFVLPSCDRHEAVRFAEAILQQVVLLTRRLEAKGTVLECVASAGVAAVALPPKNFPPHDLLTTAQRCLAAAQSSGTCVVKSLEIY